MHKNSIYYSDIDYIFKGLNSTELEKLRNSKILITGCAGFLGFYFVSFLLEKFEKLGLKKIVGIDNFKLGLPNWIKQYKKNSRIELHDLDITNLGSLDIDSLANIDYVIHMASIASPTFYRKYPLATIDANVWGLRALLDFYKNKNIKGFLFFSSSEVYGDPHPEFIPTKENYKGNVSMIGPRACYDEAKRFGETLCYVYSEQFNMPVSIVRPFNNYGPGMKLNDKRVPADFAKAVSENKKIIMYSDGSPTRTFCYVSDAIIGYLKSLLYEPFDYFNIGMDQPEISINELAQIYQNIGTQIFGYNCPIEITVSQDKNYLIHNPSRRRPDLSKAKSILNYSPSISIDNGVFRFLKFINEGGIID
ncbi:UDP-glucuronate decarboxylase [Bacillus tianshenii]|uniref:UDP-glucuronate decarboxylase n=1 Tax=Sutcliffiella tianshenii TaxID=1463404 RepID=A0ABS2P5P9_9BACI|nr:NAD-dependent epimerase/dehydratase family protein [Bacillus tianshenii]MBM7622191.1 UDP-glucuronate decarboxylase [Bacillus tianshenii]